MNKEDFLNFIDKCWDSIGEIFKKRKENNNNNKDEIINEIKPLKRDICDEENQNSETLRSAIFSIKNKIITNNEETTLRNDISEIKKKADDIYNKTEENEKAIGNILSTFTTEIKAANEAKKEAEENLKISKNENETLQNEIEKLNQVKDTINNKNEKIEKELKDFKSVFEDEKIINLLNAIFKCPALEEFRKAKKIIDNKPSSILNLILLLNSPKSFIDSYYNFLVEFKKLNQKGISDEEENFYVAINEYFEKEVIIEPKQRKITGEFDKLKHRGINGEYCGEIDDGIILIPSDCTKENKIKVKLK